MKHYITALIVLTLIFLLSVVGLVITVGNGIKAISNITKTNILQNTTNSIQNKILINYGKRISDLEKERK